MKESLRKATKIRRTLEGRRHTDSTELLAEDRSKDVESLAEREYTLEELLSGVTNENRQREIHTLFQNNFHVRHRPVFERQRDELVLVKGLDKSRLLRKAIKISVMTTDRTGKPLKTLSPEMQEIFGSFNGRLSFQRSPTRWVNPTNVQPAIEFMTSLW